MSLTVLIVDDEENAQKNMGAMLAKLGYETIGASTLAEARQYLSQGVGDVVLLDVYLPDGYGLNMLPETAHLPTRPPIIIMTGNADIPMAVEAMKDGAHDFFAKPIDIKQIDASLRRAQETIAMRRELNHLRQARHQQGQIIIGKSPEMRRVLSLAERAATASVSVLITGETGTGKEVLAQYIHRCSPRADKPFIAVNCAAIQATVLESELFGYEAGAFTGAERRKHGLMEVADGGILFLDEISSMPLDIQAKLLRAVEERAFRRVGGTTLIKVDVQLLAASNRNLMTMVESGQFRQDLYYRLKVLDLHLPPLRERQADIPEFVGFFIQQSNARLGMNIRDITPLALQALTAYSWPGNIRELLHAIEHAELLCDGDVIDLPHLPADVVRATSTWRGAA